VKSRKRRDPSAANSSNSGSKKKGKNGYCEGEILILCTRRVRAEKTSNKLRGGKKMGFDLKDRPEWRKWVRQQKPGTAPILVGGELTYR